MLHGRTAEYSQPHVLKQKMKQAGLSHGQEVRVNLRGVQVRRTSASEGIVYFCNMKQIEVLEVLQEGDGAPLPDRALVENLFFPGEGLHDLSGVILSSNGVLQVRADEKTSIPRRGLAAWLSRWVSSLRAGEASAPF